MIKFHPGALGFATGRGDLVVTGTGGVRVEGAEVVDPQHRLDRVDGCGQCCGLRTAVVLLAAVVVAVGGDEDLRFELREPAARTVCEVLLRARGPHRSHGCAGEHGHHRGRDVGHVGDDPVPRLDALAAEPVGESSDPQAQFVPREGVEDAGLIQGLDGDARPGGAQRIGGVIRCRTDEPVRVGHAGALVDDAVGKIRTLRILSFAGFDLVRQPIQTRGPATVP
jgi:hypothetical protein